MANGKRIVIEIDDNYAGVLSITAVGSSVWETRVSTTSIELSKCQHILLKEDGRWVESPVGGSEDG